MEGAAEVPVEVALDRPKRILFGVGKFYSTKNLVHFQRERAFRSLFALKSGLRRAARTAADTFSEFGGGSHRYWRIETPESVSEKTRCTLPAP